MTEAKTLAVAIRGITKAFGSCVANASADLEVEAGEVHALVGENGAGKSTLMRMLAGLTRPDSGTIHVLGRDVTGWSTAQAIEAGVGMVHQHFMLVPTLTVAENVVLGREPRRGPSLDLARARDEVEKLSRESGLEVPADRLVGDLPVGTAQRVEILKTLYRGARVLILDEPTAVLSPPEVADFLRVIGKLRDGGTTIVLITHKLGEVMSVSDRITVMRRGRTVTTLETKGTTPAEIAHAMVGRDVELPGAEPMPRSEGSKKAEGAGLVVSDLVVASSRGTRAIDGVSFEVRPGEIFGIAGVEGNGQSELVEAVAGLRAPTSGSIRLRDTELARMSVRDRERAGVAHIPEDRHRRGLVLDFSVAENLVLGRQDRFTRFGLVDHRRLGEHAAKLIRDLDIRPTDPELPARSLSGGNQQKVVVARELAHGFHFLCAAQPTRGVDVGAIELIHARLIAARDAGKAILLVSAELTEILSLSDRIGVLYRGKLVRVLPRSEANADVLGPLMMGAEQGAA
jgi:simple sugar transport system ATP-binding protein